jgi:catechol 2,3-dioxygenase-like lactoylglutathione lyase family enzyme
MWGKPPFWISNNCGVDVRNLGTARDWYKKALGLREVSSDWQDDSGRPFVGLCAASDDAILTLVERGAATSVQNEHVIFFAKNLEKARQRPKERGVAVEAVTSDSGGNRFFRFQDLEGNAIEVCIEPGKAIVG